MVNVVMLYVNVMIEIRIEIGVIYRVNCGVLGFTHWVVELEVITLPLSGRNPDHRYSTMSATLLEDDIT